MLHLSRLNFYEMNIQDDEVLQYLLYNLESGVYCVTLDA